MKSLSTQMTFVTRNRFVIQALACSLLIAACTANVGCAQWQSSDKGTLVGAAAGGALGSAIGKKSGNPITGAIIGALGGGIVGNAVGEGMDQRRAYEQQQQYYQQPAYQSSNPYAGSVSLDQVVSLTRSGLSDDVIISHVESNGFNQTLTANDLIILKNNGVSDRVIGALQRPVRPAGPTVIAPPTVVRPSVTYVEEVRVVPTYYSRPVVPVYMHGPHHHHRGSSVHMRFGF